MKMKTINKGFVGFYFLFLLLFAACQTNNSPTTSDTTTTTNRSLAPQRVDIRGSIISKRYNQGQVFVEIESLTTLNSPNSRYNRAYVLVLPTTQIVGPDGKTLSYNDLQQGQRVAAYLRGGGKGNLEGMGIARKMWVEAAF